MEVVQFLAVKLCNKRSRDFKRCVWTSCLVYGVGAVARTSCVLLSVQHVRMKDEGKNNSQNKKVTKAVKKIECETYLM
jgi:hypothetical protein